MKKKIFILIVMVMVMMTIIPNVSAADFNGCNGILPDIKIDAKIPNIIHTIIVVIQIAVPVILVVFGMVDLLKAVMGQKEDEIKKGQQTLIKRLIAAALVFFVIVIVKLLVSLVADGDKTNFMNCVDGFLNGVSEQDKETTENNN